MRDGYWMSLCLVNINPTTNLAARRAVGLPCVSEQISHFQRSASNRYIAPLSCFRKS